MGLEPEERDDIASGNVWPDDDAGVGRAEWAQELAYAYGARARADRAAGRQPTHCVTCGAELGAVEQWAGDVECPVHRHQP